MVGSFPGPPWSWTTPSLPAIRSRRPYLIRPASQGLGLPCCSPMKRCGVRYSDNDYNSGVPFNGEIFNSGVQIRPPELFQAYGTSARPLLTPQLQIPLTQ